MTTDLKSTHANLLALGFEFYCEDVIESLETDKYIKLMIRFSPAQVHMFFFNGEYSGMKRGTTKLAK